MAAWPGEVIEERAGRDRGGRRCAAALSGRVAAPAGGDHHRAHHEQVRRHVSVDFTVPEEQREGLRISADEFVGAARPAGQAAARALRPAQRGAALDPAAHRRPAPHDRPRAAVPAARRRAARTRGDARPRGDADRGGAGRRAAGRRGPDRGARARARRRARSTSARSPPCCRATSSSGRSCAASIGGASSSSPTTSRSAAAPGFIFLIERAGCTEALSYHVEVAVPADLKARTTLLVDAATGQRLAAGERDTDRPALYFRAEPPLPQAPEIVIDFGVERGASWLRRRSWPRSSPCSSRRRSCSPT